MQREPCDAEKVVKGARAMPGPACGCAECVPPELGVVTFSHSSG